jgi:membrane protease YdiL (CAAX protease family)
MSDGAEFRDASRPVRARRYGFGAQPRAEPDPGNIRAALIGTLLVVVLIAVVATFQQLAQSSAAKSAGQPPLAPGATPPASVEMSFIAKATVKLLYAAGGPKDNQTTHSAAESVEDIAGKAGPPYARLRAAMVAGDLLGLERAEKALSELQPDAAADQELARDIEAVRGGLRGTAPAPEEAERLVRRHGWFGKLVLTHGLDRDAPDRRAVVGGGGALIAAMIGFGALVSAMILSGVVLLIVGIVRASAGTLTSRFVPPLPGGSVAVETVAVFIAGFLLLKLIVGLLAGVVGEDRALWIAMGGQWLLALLILWPMVRGVQREQALYLVGLHRGRGILREIGAGLVGYLAGLPILIIGIGTMFVIRFIEEVVLQAMGKSAEAPQNPLLELAGGAKGSAAVVLLFVLASMWAPLVEETIFRGALYRHLRGRWHWLPAGIVTALGFGLMHGYPILLLTPVISLGFGFALIREWRGSLIACMTAHCVHNAGTLIMLLTFMKLADV